MLECYSTRALLACTSCSGNSLEGDEMQFRKKITEKEFRGMSEKYRKRKSHVIRREWHGSFFLRLHRDPPKRIRHGAHKNDRGKDRAEVFDHELEDDFPLEQVAALGNFVLDLFHTDDSR